MRRQLSAGGVLVRRAGKRWFVAAIRPAGKPEGLWALPKGLYLLRRRRGRLGDLRAEHAHEVGEVCWLPLDEAPRLLAYRSEREMARRALAALAGESL